MFRFVPVFVSALSMPLFIHSLDSPPPLLSIYLHIYLSIYVHTYLSIYLPTYFPTYLSACFSIMCLSVCQYNTYSSTLFLRHFAISSVPQFLSPNHQPAQWCSFIPCSICDGWFLPSPPPHHPRTAVVGTLRFSDVYSPPCCLCEEHQV